MPSISLRFSRPSNEQDFEALCRELFRRAWELSGLQQLARTLFLTRERVVYRKLQEVLLAIQIEQRFSKDQTFTFYAISRSSVSG